MHVMMAFDPRTLQQVSVWGTLSALAHESFKMIDFSWFTSLEPNSLFHPIFVANFGYLIKAESVSFSCWVRFCLKHKPPNTMDYAFLCVTGIFDSNRDFSLQRSSFFWADARVKRTARGHNFNGLRDCHQYWVSQIFSFVYSCIHQH